MLIIRLIILLCLIFINGLLSASEIAFLSIDKYTILHKRDKKIKRISKLIEDESRFLSTIQIGITLAGFLASAFASETFTDILMDKGVLFVSPTFTENILMIIITLILSYITLVFGELVPKKIGRSNPLKVAKTTIPFLEFLSIIFKPIIFLLTKSTDLICSIFNIKDHNDTLTEKDIKTMIITGSKEGIVEEKEKEYILNIFEFNDKKAYKIMKPKSEVAYINIDDTKAKIIQKIKKYRYTRFPVLDNDKVVGYINIKNFIYLQHSNKDIKIKNLIHDVLKFDKDEKIDDIFRIMQEQHETFSVILDKDEFVGILTMEDAIEEIVGNIEDEFS